MVFRRMSKGMISELLVTVLLVAAGAGTGLTIFADTMSPQSNLANLSLTSNPVGQVGGDQTGSTTGSGLALSPPSASAQATYSVSTRKTTDLDLLFFADLAYGNWDNLTGDTIAQLAALPAQSNPFDNRPSLHAVVINLPSPQQDLQEEGNWRVIDWQNAVTTTGFYGVAFQNVNTKEIVIAFRGSSNTQDYVYDLSTIALHISADGGAQLSQARELVSRVITNHPGAQVLLTGHSLGGWLAERVALDLHEHNLPISVPYAFLGAATFNAPGFQNGDYVTNQEWQNNLKGLYDGLITNYAITEDVFGDWETPLGSPRIFMAYTGHFGSALNPLATHRVENFFYTPYFKHLSQLEFGSSN
ncbi:DUF2974 domain-containing protein [Alicyclobacillaceae bacterium I2511]|nr:DUF2974 domain-containing protein [Alicyclobacillaceae bacterium I2511]